MSEPALALKSLSKETKALIIVSEFEARRMPVFQLRAVLQAIVNDEEERKVVIDMIERDLRATGYPADQIGTFLTDLLATTGGSSLLEMGQSMQSTRRLRSPFTHGFEATPSGMTPAATSIRPTASMPPPPETTIPTASAPTRISISRPSRTLSPVVTSTSIPSVPTAPAASQTSMGTTAVGISKRPSGLQGHVLINPPPAYPAPLAATPAPQPTPSSSNLSGTATRRNTFSFVPPKPAEPIMTPLAPSATGGAEGGPAPAGTMAWRLQQAFGDNKMAPTATGVRPTILVADDDKRIRMVFRLRLEEAGMNVVECDNGLSAWERLQKNDVAAAILDMKMPGLHGLEVLSHMIDQGLSTPVVICSAYDQLQDEFVVRTYPHLRYLVKPVAPDQLVSAIRELLTPKS